MPSRTWIFGMGLALASVTGACASSRTCYSGDFEACTCADGRAGFAACDAGGEAYGACGSCGEVPGLAGSGASGGGGSGGGTSGGGGAGGGTASLTTSTEKLGFLETCTMDEDCESGICHVYAAKGPKCTLTCQTAADCPPPSPGCNNMGVCKAP